MKFCPECFAEFTDDVGTCPTDGVPLAGIEKDSLVGSRIANRYLVLSVLGRGGMGVVYKAKHEHLDRIVAVKMLHSHLVSETEAIKRFHREAKAVSRVKHPHSVGLYDFGISESGQPFIVMDYVEGVSLKKILKEEGPLTLERAGHIFSQVVDALTCAHVEGVIHRDLKPENIMLTRRASDPEWVQVVDFGISKLKSKDNQTQDQITRIGDVCGSPPYMSPEQCLASVPVDGRSDIYSLGIVLYEALSGRLPFKAKTAVEMIDCHLYANPTPLKAANPELACCEGLNQLLLRALMKEPEKRQESMDEFGREMKEAIKRDSLKLKSYKHLSQALAIEGAAEPYGQEAAEKGDTRVMGGAGEQRSTSRLEAAAGPGNIFTSMIARCLTLIGRRAKGGAALGGYTLTQCPYCAAEVEPNIKFCLDCGHNLPSPQELTRLRAAQGVFAFPKAHKSASETPEFSSRARKVLSRAGGLKLARIFLLVNLLLVLLICFFYLGPRAQTPRTAAVDAPKVKSKPSSEKPVSGAKEAQRRPRP